MNYVNRFSKNTQVSTFLKNPFGRAELFDADGLADREMVIRKLVTAFRNFANAPKTSATTLELASF